MENRIRLPVFQMRSNDRTALVCRDIALEGNSSRNWFNRGKVDTDNDALRWHTFCSNLTPGLFALSENEAQRLDAIYAYPRRRAKIQKNPALFQETIFLVQLHQLEGSSRSVSLLLRQVIPFIQTTFSVLLDNQYGASEQLMPDCTLRTFF